MEDLSALHRWDLGSMGSLNPTLEFTWTDKAFRRPFNWGGQGN